RPETTALECFVDRDRDGRGRRIPEAVDVHVDLVHRNARVLRRRFDDAVVRLMWYQHVDVAPGQLGRIERAIARLAHLTHGVLEHFAAGHLHVRRAILKHRVAERYGGTAGRPPEQLGERAVTAHEGAEDPAVGAVLRTLEHHGARAVAEQHARRA